MNDRQKEILAFVISEYIKSAQPVGSSLLSEKAGLDLSSATYRNELATLEEEGFLSQPYTSAGRVPTEKAYRFYVDQYLVKKKFTRKPGKDFAFSLKEELDSDMLLKKVAKELVEKCDQAVILAFNKNDIYYTGLSNLFSKPEFRDTEQVITLSSVVDHLDEVVNNIIDQVDDVEILIGSANPFGEACSTVIGKYKLRGEEGGMFAILGPMRMDYGKNLQLMGEVKQLVERINTMNKK